MCFSFYTFSAFFLRVKIIYRDTGLHLAIIILVYYNKSPLK